MSGVYQIVAECAYVTVLTVSGPAKTLLLKGALVPADAPEVQHLLSIGFIVPIGDHATGGVNADGEAATTHTAVEAESGTDDDTDADSDGDEDDDQAEGDALTAKRDAARAKLPGDGSAPRPGAAIAVWREYAVIRGALYADIANIPKDELIELATRA